MNKERAELVKKYLKEKLIDMMLDHALNDPKDKLNEDTLYVVSIDSKYGPKSKRKVLGGSKFQIFVTDEQLKTWEDLFPKNLREKVNITKGMFDNEA